MRRNYTLLELIVVIAILALVLTLAGGRMGAGSTRLRLKTEADEASSFLSSAKAMAIHQQRRVSVLLEDRQLVIEQLGDEQRKDSQRKIHYIGDGVEISAQARAENGKTRLFTFFPDGRGSGSPLRMKMKAHACEITVSPLSGAIAVKEIDE